MAEEQNPDELERQAEELEAEARRLKERAKQPPKATDEEIRKEEGVEPSFRDEGRPSKRGRFQFDMVGGNRPIVQVGMAVCISVLLSFFLVGQFMVSKSDFETNLKAMNDTVNAATSQMNTKVSQMSATVSGLSGTITSQVKSAVAQEIATLKGQLTTISKQITDLSAKVTADGVKITANKTNIANLLAKVTDLEDQMEEWGDGTSGTTTGDGVTISVDATQAQDVLWGDTYRYLITVKNNSGEVKKVNIEAIATIAKAVPSMDVNATINTGTRFSVVNASSMEGKEKFKMMFIPNDDGSECVRISGVSEGCLVLVPGDSETVWVEFELKYDTDSPAGLWTVNFMPIVMSFY